MIMVGDHTPEAMVRDTVLKDLNKMAIQTEVNQEEAEEEIMMIMRMTVSEIDEEIQAKNGVQSTQENSIDEMITPKREETREKDQREDLDQTQILVIKSGEDQSPATILVCQKERAITETEKQGFLSLIKGENQVIPQETGKEREETIKVVTILDLGPDRGLKIKKDTNIRILEAENPLALKETNARGAMKRKKAKKETIHVQVRRRSGARQKKRRPTNRSRTEITKERRKKKQTRKRI